MKGLRAKLVGAALAATMLLGCGTVMAAENDYQGDTMADYSASVSVDEYGHSLGSIFSFTPMYDGEYEFIISDEEFSNSHLSPRVMVGEREMSSEMTLIGGRTYMIYASVSTERYWSWEKWDYRYFSGTGSYDISVRFDEPAIETGVEENVPVTIERIVYDWDAHKYVGDYSVSSYQYTPETSGEYQVALSDIYSQYDWIDILNGNEAAGALTPAVSIYDGDDLIFFLEGEGADVTKLDENTTYLVIATADHTGTYTLTITPAPATEIHYTQEQLRAMSTNNFVGTLYTRILGRFSDAQGRAEFADDLLNHGYTATEIAQIMFTSDEFGALDMDDATFVSTVYYTFCDRAATEAEAEAMMADLAAGTTRAQIVEQMATSDEWAAFCAFYGVNV